MKLPTEEDYREFQDWYASTYHTGDSRTDMQRAWFQARDLEHPYDVWEAE